MISSNADAMRRGAAVDLGFSVAFVFFSGDSAGSSLPGACRIVVRLPPDLLHQRISGRANLVCKFAIGDNGAVSDEGLRGLARRTISAAPSSLWKRLA